MVWQLAAVVGQLPLPVTVPPGAGELAVMVRVFPAVSVSLVSVPDPPDRR
jgi:hypothetical protein